MPTRFFRNSSVFVPSGWTVVLYEGALYDGASITLTRSADCLTSVIGASAFPLGVGSLQVYSGGRRPLKIVIVSKLLPHLWHAVARTWCV